MKQTETKAKCDIFTVQGPRVWNSLPVR